MILRNKILAVFKTNLALKHLVMLNIPLRIFLNVLSTHQIFHNTEFTVMGAPRDRSISFFALRSKMNVKLITETTKLCLKYHLNLEK